jgi:ABC-type transport system substrate-binding protein
MDRTARTHRLRTASLTVTGVVVAAALTACGGQSSPDSKGSSGDAVHGDKLTVAFGAPPNSLDPATITVAFSTYTQLSYDSLIRQAPDGSLVPDLAESWEYVGDGNTQFELTLRKGATFSDGSPVDAAAVKASLDYTRTQPGAQVPLLGAISDITTRGDDVVVIKLAAPNPMLPESLTQSFGVGQIIAPSGLEPGALTVDNPSQGAGPYVYDPKASVAGNHYTYTANHAYFDQSRIHYDSIEVRVIPDPQAQLNAIKTEQIDVIAGGAPPIAATAKSAGLSVTSVQSGWLGLDFLDRAGTVTEALGDVRVRQAINYAIDRDAIAKALTGGFGVGTTQTVVEGSDGYSDKAAGQYTYDVDKAKALLADAGYADGFSFDAVSSVYAGIDAVAQAIAGQLKTVGITMNIKTDTDQQTYIGDLTSHQYAAAAIPFGTLPMWGQGAALFGPGAFVFNPFQSSADDLNALFGQAAATDDEAQRADLDQQMQEYLVENAWFAPVTTTPFFYFTRTDLGGVEVSTAAPFSNPADWYDTK